MRCDVLRQGKRVIACQFEKDTPCFKRRLPTVVCDRESSVRWVHTVLTTHGRHFGTSMLGVSNKLLMTGAPHEHDMSRHTHCGRTTGSASAGPVACSMFNTTSHISSVHPRLIVSIPSASARRPYLPIFQSSPMNTAQPKSHKIARRVDGSSTPVGASTYAQHNAGYHTHSKPESADKLTIPRDWHASCHMRRLRFFFSSASTSR